MSTKYGAFGLIACVFIVNGFITSSSKPLVQYRRDYVYLEGIDAFVKVNIKVKSWHDAKAYCEAEGASLAVIRTSAEAALVHNVTKGLAEKYRDVWIGLQDLIAEGEFETIDGEPIANVFGDWEDGEPNDTEGHEDCVLFTKNGKLNDETCSTKHPFLCKKDVVTITTNAACDSFDLEYKPVLNGQQCIKFHKTPKNWEEAYIICNAEEAQLAVINSQEEADLYISEFAKYPVSSLNGNYNKNQILLGFHDKFTQGDFVTVQNQKIADSGYANWKSGQPDNRGNVEHCGAMFRDAQLNDISCDTKALFICEKSLTDPFDVSLNARMDQ